MGDAVLDHVAASDKLSSFLVCVFGHVLSSTHATPRLKEHYLRAVPPILLRANSRSPSKHLEAACEACASKVRDMVLGSFPLNSHEFSRDSEEYTTYLSLLEGLLRSIEVSAPSIILVKQLYPTLREPDHREEFKLRSFLRRFVQRLAASPDALRILEELFDKFLDESLDDRVQNNIRFVLMEKIALPLLWEILQEQTVCVEAWGTFWPKLLDRAMPEKVLGEAPYGNIDITSLKVETLTCVYGAIEILFARTASEVLQKKVPEKLPPEISNPGRAFVPIVNKAFK